MSKVSPSLDIPKELEHVVMRSLAKKPDDRYATMARFAQALAYASRDLARARRNLRRALFVGAPVLVVLLAAVVFLALRPKESHEDATRTQLAKDEGQSRPEAPLGAPAPLAAPSLPSLPALLSEVARAPSSAMPAPSPVVARSEAPTPTPPGGSTVPLAAPAASAPVASRAVPVATGHTSKPSRPATVAPATTSLPELERCFETVAGERREVPCN